MFEPTDDEYATQDSYHYGSFSVVVVVIVTALASPQVIISFVFGDGAPSILDQKIKSIVVVAVVM
jgi:hypothetical protein